MKIAKLRHNLNISLSFRFLLALHIRLQFTAQNVLYELFQILNTKYRFHIESRFVKRQWIKIDRNSMSLEQKILRKEAR